MAKTLAARFTPPVALLGILFWVLLGATGAPAVTVPRVEIDALSEHYLSFGVSLPPDGLVLREPFSEPYSNRSFVVPRTWLLEVSDAYQKNPLLAVKASALRDDLPALRLIMERVYAGYAPARARGWDWDAWFNSWAAALERAGNQEIPLRDALQPWERFEEFFPDSHARPLVNKLFDFKIQSASALLRFAPSGPCTSFNTADGRSFPLSANIAGDQPHAVRDWDGANLAPAWYFSYPALRGLPASAICGGSSVPLTLVVQPESARGPIEYRSLGDEIAYLRIPFMFSYQSNRELRDALANAKGLGKERALILDLRGNGGGANPKDILGHWFTPHEIAQAEPVSIQRTTESCLRTGVLFNMAQYLSYTLAPPLTPDRRMFIQAQVDSLASHGVGDCERKERVTQVGSSLETRRRFVVHRAKRARTRVIALVNSDCGSDCDYFARLLSRLPDSVLVGTSTFGTVGTGVPGLLVLPRTRIPFALGTYDIQFFDGPTPSTEYGVTVDVLLPTGQSESMTSVLALAKVLAD